MSSDDYRAALDSFVADLKRVWRAVGGPPYTNLESLSEDVLRQHPAGGVRLMVLAPSTTSEILSGRRKQAPKWPWVLTFLTVLHAAARQGGIDAGVVGTTDEWQRKHEAVLAAQEAALSRPRSGGQRWYRARGGTDVMDPVPDRGIAVAHDEAAKADALAWAFLTLARQADAPRRWHNCRRIAPEWVKSYLNLESSAESIRAYKTRFIPGLLQTEAYARAVIAQYRPDVTADEIACLADLFMRRQSPRRHQKPHRLWVVVEERVFHDQQIDASIMRAQVQHLIDLTDESHITLQVVPAGTGSKLTLSEPIAIFRFPEPSVGDVICLEQPDGALFLHERKDIEYYQQLFHSIAVKAAPPAATRRMLISIRDGI
jgi:Domain of unknown function (DUF5753)